DHHAGRDFFGGGCYFNSAALSIAALRRHRAATRFAIVDTDAHHGDGTWDIFQNDPSTLYVCCCGQRSTQHKSMVNVSIPWRVTDEDYLAIVEQECVPRLVEHRPDLIYWNLGYDGTSGDYGDIGLSPGCHAELARILRDAAWNVCRGRLITVLCGGSRRSLATYIIPRVISVLAALEQ
ncbi:MAG: histone deacetylase, partial [Chloroflexota bacterium]